jgi:hypothetical protein
VDVKKLNKMIINGKNVTGLFKYSETAEYREDDLVIDLGLLYVCLKDACNKKPSENPEYFTPYPKKKILSASEYFDNTESEDYISSKALTEILEARDFGFSENGVIEDEITYNPNSGIVCSILDQVYNYDILDTIMKKPDLNNGMFKVSNNLPEIRNLLLHNSTISPYIVVRQYTYGDMRVQELVDPENKTLYIRWAEKPWDLVSEWYSIITKDVHDYISEISAFYTSKLRQYESAFRLYQNKFCFSNVPFEEESGVYKVKLESLGLESQPEDTFIINVVASKSIAPDLKRNYTAFVDLSDQDDTYLTDDSNIHLEFDSEYLTLDLGSCALKNIYYREKTSLLETPPVVIVKPSVYTIGYKEIETMKAICTVKLTSLGGDELANTVFGICYSSQYGTPVLEKPLTNRLDISDFTLGIPVDVRIENLNPNTTYYFRAFAANTEGTSYGEVLSFTTEEEHTKPGVIIKSISPGINDIKITYNVTGNNILSNGIWYSTDPSESPGNGGTVEYNTIKSSERFEGEEKAGQDYTMTLSNKIMANTKYYISAFATNSYNLTGYSDILSTTTGTTSELRVSMNEAWTNTSDSISCSGRVDDNGGYEIIKTGFIWSLEENIKNPVNLVDTEQYVSANSDFTAIITGLTPSKQYYIYAYAKNSNGSEKCSTALRCLTNSAATSPTVRISNQGSSGPDNVSAMITITNTGGSDIEKVGLWYSLSQGNIPNESDENIVWVNASEASIQLTRLTANTIYYLRGVAKNEDGYFGYSSEVTAQTQAEQTLEPELSINPVVVNSPLAASLSGSVTVPEGYTGSITERGFLYASYPNTISGVGSDNRIIEATFSNPVSGYERSSVIPFSYNWKPGIGVEAGKYNFKSYVITTTGSYISNSTVTGTLYPVPSLTTGNATSTTISGTSTANVTFNGIINNLDDFKELITSVGFKYGTSSSVLDNEIPVLSKINSNFSATVNVSVGATYYFRAFVKLKNNSYWLADNISSITIRDNNAQQTPGNDVEDNNI